LLLEKPIKITAEPSTEKKLKMLSKNWVISCQNQSSNLDTELNLDMEPLFMLNQRKETRKTKTKKEKMEIRN